MSGDGRGGRVRRSRAIERPRVPPGPLADLKALVYELYLEAGAPSLDEIAAKVAEDDELTGAPERDTINRIIRGTGVPPSQADVVVVVTVLARAARWDPDDAARRARDHWVAARMDSAVGVPIIEVTDPFALEVHRPIALDAERALPPLPRYVRRAHDERLAEVVSRAVKGGNAMAVLVGGSSAGKTRTCWEALEPIRGAGGWRLWHPYDPTRAEAALEALDRVGPRTVVWLNETQEYLRTGGDGAERVAAKLRRLLADSVRAPVLVLGTLWPEHHADLTQHAGSQVRLVLENTVIEVPEAFTGADLTSLERAAGHDVRLAWATAHADDGQITQYLAGAPELLARFDTAPPGAKALIRAAMDARRMGHRNALPLSLLEHAAPAYLTDAQVDQLDENWLEQALAYASQPCKGARGPVTRIPFDRGRTARRTPSAGHGEPAYRLADYLDQHGRTSRAGLLPPIGFWAFAATHANPDDLTKLGNAARKRGLYLDAAQLHKNATAHGDPLAARALVRHLYALHPTDPRPAEWAATHVAMSNPVEVGQLLGELHEIGATEPAAALAERAATHAPVTNQHAVESLLRALNEVGATEQVAALVERVITQVPPNLYAVESLLDELHKVGATEQVGALADGIATHAPLDEMVFLGVLLGDSAKRATPHVPVGCLYTVESLLGKLHKVGATEQVATLAGRAVTHVPLDDPHAVLSLLGELHEVGAIEQAVTLAEGAATRVPVDDPFAVAALLLRLHEVGATEQVNALAERAVSHVPLDNPHAVESLLVRLRIVGATEQAVALAERTAPLVPLGNLFAVAVHLGELHKIGATEQATALAERATRRALLDNPSAVGALVVRLHEAGAIRQATVLADRAAAKVPLGDLSAIAVLVGELHKIGATRQATALAERAASHGPVHDASAAAALLGALNTIGANEQVTTLATRVASDASLGNQLSTEWLLLQLRKVGANEQAAAVSARVVVHTPLDDSPAAAVPWDKPKETVTNVADYAAPDLDDSPTRIASRLEALHNLGATEEAAALAERAVTHVRLDSSSAVGILLIKLIQIGADSAATALAERLPAVGEFGLFLSVHDHETRFRFGREPDATAAAPWSWDDLE